MKWLLKCYTKLKRYRWNGTKYHFNCKGGESDAQLHIHFIYNWQFSKAFREKKNFKNWSIIDWDREKNVKRAPTFGKLPPPLWRFQCDLFSNLSEADSHTTEGLVFKFFLFYYQDRSRAWVISKLYQNFIKLWIIVRCCNKATEKKITLNLWIKLLFLAIFVSFFKSTQIQLLGCS